MRGPLDVSESSFSEFCRVSAVVALQWGTFSRTVVVDLYIYVCVERKMMWYMLYLKIVKVRVEDRNLYDYFLLRTSILKSFRYAVIIFETLYVARNITSQYKVWF